MTHRCKRQTGRLSKEIQYPGKVESLGSAVKGRKLNGKMSEANIKVDTAVPSVGLKSRDFRRRSGYYKITLVLHDLLIVGLILVLIFRMNLAGFGAAVDMVKIAALCLICLVAIAYYPTQNLYNYHLIYSSKYHLLGQLKAAGLSLLTLVMVAGLYTVAVLPSKVFFILFVMALSLAAVIGGRYLQEFFLHFLTAIGIAFVIIGIAGLVSKGDASLLLVYGVEILTTILAASLVLLVSRYFLVHIVFSTWMKKRFRSKVIIIGSDEEAKRIGKHIIDSNAPFWLVGAIASTDAKIFLDIGIEKCFLGSLNKLSEVVETDRISEIIITDEKINKRTLVDLLDYCTKRGVNAWFSPKMMPVIDLKLYIDNFCGVPLIRFCSQKNSWLFSKVKHTLDALLTLPGFVVQLPLFLVIAAAIKLESRGPVFYCPVMIGKTEKPFRMYKFRSMHVNSDHSIHKEYVSKLIKGDIGKRSAGDGPLKIANDPRVTRVGRFLRKNSLDELPQLINVLKGEMSLVGPRPCLPYEYEMYQDWDKKRTVVRPGLTGLWQVVGRSSVSFEDMVLLDLYYIYNSSLMLDLSILYETVFAVFSKRGAY